MYAVTHIYDVVMVWLSFNSQVVSRFVKQQTKRLSKIIVLDRAQELEHLGAIVSHYEPNMSNPKTNKEVVDTLKSR